MGTRHSEPARSCSADERHAWSSSTVLRDNQVDDVERRAGFRYFTVAAAAMMSFVAVPLRASAVSVGSGCTASQSGTTRRAGSTTLRCTRERSGSTTRFVWRRIPTPTPSGSSGSCLVTGGRSAWKNTDPATYARILSAGRSGPSNYEVDRFEYSITFVEGEVVSSMAVDGTSRGTKVSSIVQARARYTPSATGWNVTEILEDGGSLTIDISGTPSTTPLRFYNGATGPAPARCSGDTLVITLAGPAATVEVTFRRSSI